ncbi:hypothetical protein F5883DRAFT_547585 [Diaporthe sp. PMI_573]|nr:hypothetical protein F5883DRAFT_547585 [Diaporthaceae sp. PMI_573]
MVQRCLIIVLDRFNANNVGPKFHFVRDPSYSAFYVTFGGRDPLYANSFFPGSHPRDWYIDVYTSALTLSEDQAQSLMETRLGDFAVAKAQALEQNLVKILTHEMLHVVGVRHCDAQVTETADRCVRFPPSLSDEENNEELLMQPTLDWRCLSQVEWKDRTIQEIQQIYAMKVGDRIGRHRIRDVSWELGAKKRKEIALRNARWCGA